MPTTETGPYSDADFNSEFLRTQRSDWPYVVQRLLTLTLVFWFMGRAIGREGLTAGMLFLPLAVEFLAMMWIGLFLSWFVVDCPFFAKSAKKPGLIIFWTLLIAAIVCVVLAYDSQSLSMSRIQPAWISGWHVVMSTGLIWALVTEAVAPAFSTIPDVRRWRRERGPFLWASTFGLGLRMTAFLLLGVALVFFLMLGADWGGSWFFEEPARSAWLVFGFLLSVEIGALILGVLWHRDLKRGSPKDQRNPPR